MSDCVRVVYYACMALADSVLPLQAREVLRFDSFASLPKAGGLVVCQFSDQGEQRQVHRYDDAPNNDA
jgi:hypothetical protein